MDHRMEGDGPLKTAAAVVAAGLLAVGLAVYWVT